MVFTKSSARVVDSSRLRKPRLRWPHWEKTRISLGRHERGITGLFKREWPMLENLSMIEGEYLQDILDQPHALENTQAGLDTSKSLRQLVDRLKDGKFHRVVLTGMGSSFYALHPLNLDLISHGFTALMVETSELVHYKNHFFTPRTLIIAVSQSGQSAEIVR